MLEFCFAALQLRKPLPKVLRGNKKTGPEDRLRSWGLLDCRMWNGLDTCSGPATQRGKVKPKTKGGVGRNHDFILPRARPKCKSGARLPQQIPAVSDLNRCRPGRRSYNGGYLAALGCCR